MLPDLLIVSPILWEWTLGNADPGDEGDHPLTIAEPECRSWEGRSWGKGDASSALSSTAWVTLSDPGSNGPR